MAKANSAARSLIQISKTQGWDSTRIWDQEKGAYVESIEPWDHPREPFDRTPMGNIPTGAPREDFGREAGSKDPTGGPTMSEKVTFEYPEVSREAKVSGKPKMSLSDPDEAMPGAS